MNDEHSEQAPRTKSYSNFAKGFGGLCEVAAEYFAKGLGATIGIIWAYHFLKWFIP